MAECKEKDEISALRAKQHVEIENLRKINRGKVSEYNRMKLLESRIENDISLSQVKGLILEIQQKRKRLDADILKRIKNCCSRAEFIEAFFKINGAVDALIYCLKHKDAQIQLEAVACFTNLACGNHKLCFRICKVVGAYLVSFVAGSSHYLQAQSAWAIRNIANDCSECYAKLKAQGVFPALLKALMSPMLDVVESVVYALSACLKYGDLDLVDINKEEYTNYFLQIIEDNKLPSNTIREAASILVSALYIAIGANYSCNNFNTVKLLNNIKNLMQNENDYLVALLLIRCLGYLTTHEWMVQYLFDDIVFHEIVMKTLSHSSHFMKKELFWVLTNISVSHEIDTNHILFLPILKTIELFLTPLDPSVLSVLYYICCSTNHSKIISSAYKQYGLTDKIQNLAKCGNVEIEISAKMCLKVVEDQS